MRLILYILAVGAVELVTGCGGRGNESLTSAPSQQCATQDSIAGYMNPDNPSVSWTDLIAPRAAAAANVSLQNSAYSLRFIAIGVDGPRAHRAQTFYVTADPSVEAHDPTCAASATPGKISLREIDSALKIPFAFTGGDGSFTRHVDLTFDPASETKGEIKSLSAPITLDTVLEAMKASGAKVRMYRSAPSRVYFTIERVAGPTSSGFIYRMLACYTET